jgi:peroxiredoxin
MKRIMVLLFLVAVAGRAGDLKPLEIGQSAPAFTLKNYDGSEVGLKKVLAGHKFAVVMFMSTECPVSNAYNDRMKKLADAYAAKGVEFIGINANKAEDAKAIADHAKEHGFKFPVLKDAGNKVADLYAAQVTPETFVINAEGKLLYHGRIDDNRKIEKVTTNDLALALDALLAGKPVASATARAFGCSIKRVGGE